MPAVPRLSLDDAIAQALAANKALAAARLRQPVDRAGIDVAAERPNPEFNFESERETPRQAFGTAWPIETANKREHRMALARAVLDTGVAEVDRVAAEIRNGVRRAYFGLVSAEHHLAASEELAALATRARDAARARVEAGAAPRLEALQAELALADAENEVTAARAGVVAGRGELNTLLGRAPDTAFAPSDELGAGMLPALDSALGRALAANADIRVLDRLIGEETARVGLARALRFPDVAAAGSLTFNAEPEFSYGWRVGASVTVPVFTRHRAGVLLEEAELARLRAERDALATQVTGAVFSALARATAGQQQFLRFRDEILPRALEVERMAEDSYRSGQTGLVALLQALQGARDIRVRGLQAGFDYEVALADLERAVGAPLR